MLNFKIIETSDKYPDILLHRDRDENNEFVEIKAIGTSNNIDDYFITEKITFETKLSAMRFIYDFSVSSAEQWCNYYEIKY